MTKGTRRFAVVFAFVAAATLAYIGYRVYELYMEPIVEQTAVVRFPSAGSSRQLMDTLYRAGVVSDTARLREMLRQLDFSYRSGQFELRAGMSAKELVRHLRLGKQKEARVVLTHGRVLGDVAAQATRFVEADSAAFHTAIVDSVWLDSMALAPHTAMSLLVPNTYNVYWNATPEELRDRLAAEARKFWEKNDRLAKADSLGLSPLEVYTLASIVESETKVNAEKPTVAGVYLNRLERGIKLDADPTVIYGIGDFGIRRVLYEHLEYDSPYNTYLYAGLPPGPIAMPAISSIDAVLEAEDHDYLFFVANGDGTGTHAFAKNMTGHSRNIERFKRNLRSRGIRR